MTYRKIAKEIKRLALDLLQRRMPIEDVCDLLLLNPRSMRRWRSNVETFGDVEPPALLPQGRPPIIPSDVLDFILILLQGEPSTYLEELRAFLSGEFNIAISTSALQENLQRAGMTHKKLTTLAKERSETNRNFWWQYVSEHFTAAQIICTDESHKDVRTHSRKYGWSMRGTEAFESTPFVRGERYSMLPAFTTKGFIALRIVEGSINAAEFHDFVMNDIVSTSSCH